MAPMRRLNRLSQLTHSACEKLAIHDRVRQGKGGSELKSALSSDRKSIY